VFCAFVAYQNILLVVLSNNCCVSSVMQAVCTAESRKVEYQKKTKWMGEPKNTSE